MSDRQSRTDPRQLGRELLLAEEALRQPGGGAIGSLECRVAGLRDELLATPARSLDEVVAKLEVLRALIAASAGEGYALHLCQAILREARALSSG